jgi:hypothetical protein
MANSTNQRTKLEVKKKTQGLNDKLQRLGIEEDKIDDHL